MRSPWPPGSINAGPENRSLWPRRNAAPAARGQAEAPDEEPPPAAARPGTRKWPNAERQDASLPPLNAPWQAWHLHAREVAGTHPASSMKLPGLIPPRPWSCRDSSRLVEGDAGTHPASCSCAPGMIPPRAHRRTRGALLRQSHALPCVPPGRVPWFSNYLPRLAGNPAVISSPPGRAPWPFLFDVLVLYMILMYTVDVLIMLYNGDVLTMMYNGDVLILM